MNTLRSHSKYLILAITLTLSACAARPGPESLTPIAPVANTISIPVYVATTRELDASMSKTSTYIFNENRAQKTSYARYMISAPKGYHPTSIQWTNETPNPTQDFAITDVELLNKNEFFNTLAPRNQEVGVGIFVHGFNTNYPESLYRAIQLASDTSLKGRSLLFAWPSQGTISGYLSDKESLLYSRDAFTQLLSDLNRRPNVKSIVVVAHSMGALLLMESLRQIRLQGNKTSLNKLNVILAMPDLDQDVFLKQLSTIGRLETPITILVTPQDRAIKISSFLSHAPRIGTLDVTSPAVQNLASDNMLRIIDVTSLPSTYMGHDRFVNMGNLLPELVKDTRKQNSRSKPTGVFIFDAIDETLSLPNRLLNY